MTCSTYTAYSRHLSLLLSRIITSLFGSHLGYQIRSLRVQRNCTLIYNKDLPRWMNPSYFPAYFSSTSQNNVSLCLHLLQLFSHGWCYLLGVMLNFCSTPKIVALVIPLVLVGCFLVIFSIVFIKSHLVFPKPTEEHSFKKFASLLSSFYV